MLLRFFRVVAYGGVNSSFLLLRSVPRARYALLCWSVLRLVCIWLASSFCLWIELLCTFHSLSLTCTRFSQVHNLEWNCWVIRTLCLILSELANSFPGAYNTLQSAWRGINILVVQNPSLRLVLPVLFISSVINACMTSCWVCCGVLFSLSKKNVCLKWP